MSITVKTKEENLKQIFDKVHRVFYFADANKKLSEQTEALELPVLEDGVSFDTGQPDVTEVKLTDESTWTSKSVQGDADISFQVASVHEKIAKILMEYKESATDTAEFEGVSYTAQGYSLSPKKVACALLLTSEDKTSAVYLPNVEMFSSFNGEGGDDSTGYFNVSVTPLNDSKGCSFYILYASTSGSSNGGSSGGGTNSGGDDDNDMT